MSIYTTNYGAFYNSFQHNMEYETLNCQFCIDKQHRLELTEQELKLASNEIRRLRRKIAYLRRKKERKNNHSKGTRFDK